MRRSKRKARECRPRAEEWTCENGAILMCLRSLQVNPEITTFDDYFKKDYDDATYSRMEKGTFFSAAFAQHWHNRYDWGIPERSWAGILFRRHQQLLAKKVC